MHKPTITPNAQPHASSTKTAQTPASSTSSGKSGLGARKASHRRLEDQQWYHGVRSRDEISHELKYKGDFLVRCTNSRGKVELVLNVLGETGGSISNLTLVFTSAGRYCLNVLRNDTIARRDFDSVPELVEYYKHHRLPGDLLLENGVSRPIWLLKHRDVRTLERLGEGNFCEVYRGRMMDRLGALVAVAVKIWRQAKQDADQVAANEARRSLLREGRIMATFKHENVIEFLGIACDHFPIMLVMGLCPGGSLLDHIKKRGSEIEPLELTLYAFEAARGMRYLHAQGCIHRDLAARNCLISDTGLVKIADFGLSKVVATINALKGEDVLTHIAVRWMAPEVLVRAPLYTHNSDVYSYSCMLYEIFNNGLAPHHDIDNLKSVARRIRSGDQPSLRVTWPPVIITLIPKCWSHDPVRRPTFNDITATLLEYLSENFDDLPPPENFAVNQIEGVKRDFVFTRPIDELLNEIDEKAALISPTHATHRMQSGESIARRRPKNRSSELVPKYRSSETLKTAETLPKYRSLETLKTTEALKTSEAPLKTSEAPLKTAEAPLKTAETPLKTAETPLKTTRTHDEHYRH